MKVLIENYRGFDIYFNTTQEMFEAEAESYDKGSKSFAAVKSGIDEYFKNNSEFKPFKAIRKADGQLITIIGIRKDGRFNYEDSKGNKKQLSEYDERDYVIYNGEEHDKHFAKSAYLETVLDEARREIERHYAKLTGDTIKQIKANYIVK